MQSIKAVYDGINFNPTQTIPVQGRYETIITFIEPIHDAFEEKPKRGIKLGFLKDKVPDLSDSFFDPLSEEELQAWGL